MNNSNKKNMEIDFGTGFQALKSIMCLSRQDKEKLNFISRVNFFKSETSLIRQTIT